MSRPRRFVLLNTHSVLNAGDAGIVLAQIRLLRREFPGAVISVTSRTPKIDAAWLGPLGVRVFPPLLPGPGGRTQPEMDRGIAGPWSAPGSRIGLLCAIRRSDLAISTGGGYFYSHRRVLPGPTFYQNILHVRAALAFRRPVVFFPQSFGPCLSLAGERSLTALLRRPGVRAILAREGESSDYLGRLLPKAAVRQKIEVCPDAAFLLRPGAAGGTVRLPPGLPRPVIAVTLREWSAPRPPRNARRASVREDYLGALEGTLAGIQARRGGSIVIVPHSRGPRPGEDDRPISKVFRDRLERRLPSGRVIQLGLPDLTGPDDLISLFESADLVLATRFHSAVFALCAGTPVLTIGYQPKARETMRLLGLEHLALEWEGLRGADLEARAEELFASPAEARAEIAARVRTTRQSIEETLGRVLAEALP